MKMLKKLALVSAISMISAGSFAMEAMDEDTMSATTGQDGITINIVPDTIRASDATAMGVTTATQIEIGNIGGVAAAPFYKGLSIGEIRVHDDDGYGAEGSATHNSGALVIGGGDIAAGGTKTALSDRTVILSKGDKPIQINLDMIGDANSAVAGNQAMLRVEIKQPKLAIKLGNIYVANSNASTATRDADGALVGTLNQDGNSITESSKAKILDGLEIVMAESTLIIRLGNEDSSNTMITADATLTGGLTLNNFALYDESGAAATTGDDLMTSMTPSAGGNFRASSIKITDNGGANLTTVTGIDFGSRISNTAVSVTGRDAMAVQLGAADYATASATVQAAVNYRESLITGALATTDTWGGRDTYNGLVITSQLGDATNGADITIANAAVGDINAQVIGDVQILGLKLGTSKIVIMGH